MRILDVKGNELTSPDLELGYLREDKILIAHHEAIEAMEGEWHYETEREYPNGSKDLKRVWDVEPIKAVEAWDEYEDIQRYILYTPNELAALEVERGKPTPEEKIAELEEALDMLLKGATE